MQEEIDQLIRKYERLKKKQELIDNQVADCKKRANLLLEQAQSTTLTGTRRGVIQWVEPCTVVSYDRKSLDVLAEHSPALREQIWHHRLETQRTGYIKITP